MRHLNSAPETGKFYPLRRRDYALGFVQQLKRPEVPDANTVARHWQADEAMMVPGLLDLQLWRSEIRQSRLLMEQTLETGEVSPILEQPPYSNRLLQNFPLVASSFEEHDEQGIEKIYFDAEIDSAGERVCVAEDLWCKASWLSFIEADASLRFRFSFGIECLEDVAADPERQRWAGHLCDAIFPESAVITANSTINSMLQTVVGGVPAFVERIVYFNAPNGGAQMHHDVERGHDGVVYGQISGSTFWLALGKQVLMDEFISFVGNDSNVDEIERLLPDADARVELKCLSLDRQVLAAYMDEFDHELVEAMMDRSPLFARQLVEHGYGFILHAGDVLLMPQRDSDTCVWHSVICLGDEPGEALSFAVRKAG
ncbi:MAG: hypothetical protein Q9M08_08260 [Mariprofundus sp.]|nr:hypothetical protein [Mariprofundus sp.]